MPVERIYALKFWSRCYLRWHEKYHAYNSWGIVEKTAHTQQQQAAMMPTRPPPQPPKPKLKEQAPRANSIISSDKSEDFEEFTVL